MELIRASTVHFRVMAELIRAIVIHLRAIGRSLRVIKGRIRDLLNGFTVIVFFEIEQVV